MLFYQQAYVTLMTDYMTHLRAYIEILNDKDKNSVPPN